MHIVVTGANRGVGLAFCQHASNLGHQVTGLCRVTSPELDALKVHVVTGVDVTDPPDLQDLDSIDWLVLNAGIWRDESLEALDFSTMAEQFAVNTLGPLRVFEKLSDKLSSNSKVGLLTSQMGSMSDNTSGGRYGYRCSKAALNSVGVSLSHDLRSRGIVVALLHPGYVATDMTKHKGTIQPDESAKGLYEVMSSLTLDDSGKFWNYRGDELPW